jgi:hypothetical protein
MGSRSLKKSCTCVKKRYGRSRIFSVLFVREGDRCLERCFRPFAEYVCTATPLGGGHRTGCGVPSGIFVKAGGAECGVLRTQQCWEQRECSSHHRKETRSPHEITKWQDFMNSKTGDTGDT